MKPNPSSLDRILREQRAAAIDLPARGAVLGVSDWVAEEVLVSSDRASEAKRQHLSA
jgi:hypothetical protein